MSINDIFWLFLMLTALQPVLRHNILNAARAHKIARLESQRTCARCHHATRLKMD